MKKRQTDWHLLQSVCRFFFVSDIPIKKAPCSSAPAETSNSQPQPCPDFEAAPHSCKLCRLKTGSRCSHKMDGFLSLLSQSFEIQLGADGGDSKNQVLRYVRLTYLIPELLQLVDDGKIALTPAVELSYLPEKAQTFLLEEMRRNDCTPSLSQAIRLKKEYLAKTLTVPKLRSIMGEEKANQKERLKIPMERIRKFFPKSYTPNQIEEAVVKLCENNYRRRTEQER